MAEQKTAPQMQRGGGPGGGRGPRGGYQKPKNATKTIGRLMKYLSPTIWPLLLVLVCLIASVGTNLGGTYMMRSIINNFIYVGNVNMSGFVRAILMLVGIYIAGAIASYCQSAIMVQLAQRGMNRLRRELFDKLQTLPLSYFDKHPHGELMSRFTNDADNVQMALEQSVVSLFSSSLMFVGLVVLMLVTNWKLFFVTAITLFLALQTFRFFGGRSRTHYKSQQAALGAVNGEIQEIIEGLKVVKAFTHEEEAKEKFNALNENLRVAASGANFYSNTIMPIANNLMNIGFALTAALGGLLSVVQGFDLGGLFIYLQYSKQVGQPLNQISQQMTSVLSALAGAERIFDLMDTEPELDTGKITLVRANRNADGSLRLAEEGKPSHHWMWRVPKGGHITLVPTRPINGKPQESPAPVHGCGWAWKYADPDGTVRLHPLRGRVLDQGDFWYGELRGAVRFQNVDFSYVEGKPVLKQVSVYANPGQKIAFVGSTGAGKTTITNLINRFYEIDAGLITYDGLNVSDIRKDDLRRSLGAVLQDTHLFTGTIMDNIRYGRLDATDDECIAAAKSADAHSFIRRLPEGYQTVITGDGANLSQGQRQLLAIARAAVADPPVLILDEATSSIDTRTERHIEKGMDALMQDRTVFVIAHRLSTVRNSNCIVVIEHGEIEEKGDHAELIALGGRYQRLYSGQFQLE